MNKIAVLNATEYAAIINEGSTVGGGNIIFPDPVSYTHLDVYKRQFLSCLISQFCNPAPYACLL